MGIDLTKIQGRLENLNNRGGKGDKNFWRPQDGEQTLRIVPTADGDPFKDFWFHYEIGNNPGFLCPKKNFGDNCPVCAFAGRLFDENTEESRRMAKKFLPRQRFFSPVLVRGEEDKGVRMWGYGKMAYESLLNLVLNPEYGDITDVEEGTDLVINYGKPPGASFPQTKITPRRRNSVLCNDAVGGDERCAELLQNIPDHSTLFDRKTSDDVATLLDEALTAEPDAAESSSTDTGAVTKATSGDSANVVDQAFKELLGE